MVARRSPLGFSVYMKYPITFDTPSLIKKSRLTTAMLRMEKNMFLPQVA